jgi:hypothetical protein
MAKNRCVTMNHHRSCVDEDSGYGPRAIRIEKKIQNWVASYRGAGLRTGVIRIPVVVHVIYNAADQNIPDRHIHSQIDVLNADFRRLNADAVSTPKAFAGVAADARLEFALAVRDPSGKPTNGITRTKTEVEGWLEMDNGMKAKAKGHDPWDVHKYLNIWVVRYLGEDTLGYGTRPPMPSEVQGVVLDYRAFGTIGDNFLPNAGRGRTATHEIGHWLDLIHIWGNDEGPSCADSDNVDDTPNQKFPTAFSAFPARPNITCSNGPHGDMFMNYMDASGDECRNMFTAGQVARMYAALYTRRAGILDSQGLVPPIEAPHDLWIKNGLDDVGTEPDPSTQPMYASDDIWVRTTNDGLLHPDHENPVYRPKGSASNYVYVRVRNRGCRGTGKGTLKLYWAKASTGLSWPSPWDGSVAKPVLMGGLIGSKKIAVKPGESKILEFPWSPPNPEKYAAAGADQSPFSLLARIETSPAAPYGMTFPETGDLYANVKNNNKIAWKNIAIVNNDSGRVERFASAIVANSRAEAEAVTLFLQVPARDHPAILDWGRVFVELPPGLVAARNSDKPAGVRPVDKNTFEVAEPEARLGTFELAPGAMHVLRIRLVPRPDFLGVHVLTWDLVQKVGERVVGGQRFVIKTPPNRREIPIDHPANVFNGVRWVPAGKS